MLLKFKGQNRQRYQKESGPACSEPNARICQQLIDGEATPAISHDTPAEDTVRGQSVLSLNPLVSLTLCLPTG